jgi:hypothetical protein
LTKKEQAEVKIIQEFYKDNIPSISIELLRSFRKWLVDNDHFNKRKLRKSVIDRKNISRDDRKSNYFRIEKLFETPMPCLEDIVCLKY